MNRIDLIAKLALKRANAAPYQPKGMSCPEQKVVTKPRDRKRGLGVLLRGNWGAMEKPAGLRYDWVHEADKRTACFKVVGRKGAHHLTRIAERLRRR